MSERTQSIIERLRGVSLTRAEADEIISFVNSRATLPDTEEVPA